MHKRKIDVNQLKKQCIKGRVNNKSAKYETVFSFFKQKDPESREIFRVRFPALARELLEALITYDSLSKLDSKEAATLLPPEAEEPLKLQTFALKDLSGEYPVREILECLFVQRVLDERTKKGLLVLGITEHKLIPFFKRLRDSYPEFCIGDKVLLEETEYTAFYEAFKHEWQKRQQKGRDSDLLRLEKRIVRCLHTFTALVENSILVAIDEKEKREKARQEQFNLEIGTKSEKKKNSKAREQHSTCSKNSTELISNFSIKPMSQKSNEDLELKIEKIDHSQKSVRIVAGRNYQGLFEKAELRNLKCPVETGPLECIDQDPTPSFINLLGDGVQNVLLGEAFRLAAKMSRFAEPKPYNICMPGQLFLPNHMYGYSQGYIPIGVPPPIPVGVPLHYQFSPVSDTRQQELQEMQELHQLRRSVDMFPAFNIPSNIDTMSVRNRQQHSRLIMRNSNKSNK